MKAFSKKLIVITLIIIAGGIYLHLSKDVNVNLLPSYKTDEVLITHPGFTLLYNEDHEQADWVAYELTSSQMEGKIERTDDFRFDTSIATGSAELSDYRGSGYDRGHLIPAADVKWSAEAMSSSFYMSNMSPQHPSFNRGGWNILEDLVRDWTIENNKVYIVTGPALKKGIIESIGINEVSVPQYYYKVILDYEEPELKGVGFIMPNKKISDPISSYAVSIDSVESFTGHDFYPALSNTIENEIESMVELSMWNLNTTIDKPLTDASEDITPNNASQCLGITQDGSQCKRETTNENGYCWQHQK